MEDIINKELIDKDISDFLDFMSKKYGTLPKFLHNLGEFNNKILYSGSNWDKNELSAALKSFLFSSWSINGEYVKQFENEFSKKINIKYTVSTNSGSSANLVMLAAIKKHLKWEDESEVLVSPVAFSTTVSTIYQNRLTPVFVDIDFNDLNLNLDELEKKITKKTVAIFIAPTLGNPGNFSRLLEIKNKYNIELIGDFCDSIGSFYKGKHLSEYVLACSCSYFSSHHLSLLQYGSISTNILEIANICRRMISWGRRCSCRGSENLLLNGSCGIRWHNWLRTCPDLLIDDKYFFKEMGYNLQPLDFQGAIGIEQLKKWDFIHSKREEYNLYIKNLFSKYLPEIKHPTVLPESKVSWFGVGLICPDKEYKYKLVQFLEKNGIQTRNYFSGNILMHDGFEFLDNWKEYPNANKVLELVFFIGCAPFYTEKHLQYIEEVLKLYKTMDRGSIK